MLFYKLGSLPVCSTLSQRRLSPRIPVYSPDPAPATSPFRPSFFRVHQAAVVVLSHAISDSYVSLFSIAPNQELSTPLFVVHNTFHPLSLFDWSVPSPLSLSSSPTSFRLLSLPPLTPISPLKIGTTQPPIVSLQGDNGLPVLSSVYLCLTPKHMPNCFSY